MPVEDIARIAFIVALVGIPLSFWLGRWYQQKTFVRDYEQHMNSHWPPNRVLISKQVSVPPHYPHATLGWSNEDVIPHPEKTYTLELWEEP